MIVKNPVIRKIPADDRKGIIGGSQIGAIAGYPGYVTEYRVWRDYMGYKDKVDPEQQWTYDKGHILEESTAKMFEKRTGIKLALSDAYVDPDHPFLPPGGTHPCDPLWGGLRLLNRQKSRPDGRLFPSSSSSAGRTYR